MDTDKILEKLTEVAVSLKETQDAMNTKTVTGHTAPLLHGHNGLFTGPIERDVITAMVRSTGIGSQLPLIPSVMEDPRFASISGYTDVIGAEPTNPCADAPYGYLKGCTLTAKFGLLRRDTNQIDIMQTMMKLNRGDFTDLVLRGRVLGMSNLAPRDMNEQDLLTVLTKSEMINAGVQAERKLLVDMWQGTIAAGTFPGLDSQIATGQKDAESGTTCPALDSDVKNFAYDLVGGTGRDIVEYISSMEFYIRTNASRMGLDPATWAIVMKAELWFELSAVWPCSYLSNKCNPGNGTVYVNGSENVTMRDDMRNGLYIDINGNRYPVIIDDGIYEFNSTNDANLAKGEYASSVYMVPLTITGGFPVTYREYLDYSAASSDTALLQNTQMFWTDGGAYSWAVEYLKWCFKMSLRTEQRVVLRTPQLAGKIQKVKYTPLQHLRSNDPKSPYFMDGGVSIRNTTFGQAVWK